MNIRKAFLPLLLLLTPVAADSALVGTFNKSLDLEPVLARDFTDGFWMAGDQYRAWGLVDTARSGSPTVFFLAVQYLHGIDGNNQSAGFSIGFPIGNTTIAVVNAVVKGIQADADPVVVPGWLQNVSNYTTVQAGGGYNFIPMFNYIKPWFADFSLAVKVPFGPGSSL
jgi:hypothetical protein